MEIDSDPLHPTAGSNDPAVDVYSGEPSVVVPKSTVGITLGEDTNNAAGDTKRQDKIAPCKTIYIRGLNEKIKVARLKKAIRERCRTFGTVVDVQASHTLKMRGQAFVSFENEDIADQAVKALNQSLLFEKNMIVQFAKTKSDKVAKFDHTYVPRSKRNNSSANDTMIIDSGSNAYLNQPQPTSSQDPYKPKKKPPAPQSNPPNRTLFLQNVALDTSVDTLQNLFKPFQGYIDARIALPGIAFVEYSTNEYATAALKALQGTEIGSQKFPLVISYAKN